MPQPIPDGAVSPMRRKLSWEIGLALAIKVVLLTVLWALFFREHLDDASAEATVKSWFNSTPQGDAFQSNHP